MSIRRVLGLFLLIGLSTSAGFGQSRFGGWRRITLIHFNDFHAHLTTHDDLIADAPPGQISNTTRIVKRGGLARLATVIKQIRANNPTVF